MLIPSTELYSYLRYRSFNDLILYYEGMTNLDNQYQDRLITPAQALFHKGNFFTLLDELNVPPELQLPTMYLNGLTSPYDYDGEEVVIKIANQTNFPRQ